MSDAALKSWARGRVDEANYWAARCRRAEEALAYLADPESWIGNPESLDAVLYGHDTPYELAVAVLAEARETPKQP